MANSVSQKQGSSEYTFQLVDNRSEAIVQRKLQEIANNSPQTKQNVQLQAMTDKYTAQPKSSIQGKENNTGLPDDLKTGIENLSGYSMDDVNVHYNSDKPAQLQAHAYAQGTDIHLGPGQEKYLPHEAWHVMQQKQGRVKPTVQMKGGVNVNDDAGLEQEADKMGDVAMQAESHPTISEKQKGTATFGRVYQRIIDFSNVSKTVPVNDLQELITFLVAKYGANHRGFIEDKVNEIQKQLQTWSLYQVYRYFVNQHLPVYSDVAFGQHSSRPTLPGSTLDDRARYAAINQFGFNTVTRLVGIVGSKKFETRNNTGDDQHAEEVFMEQVDQSGIELGEETQIVITINNSPCHAKCASLLADWVKNRGLRNVTIHFANPYGSDEEFSEAIKILQGARIKIHGFNPLDNIGSDTDDEIEDGYRERLSKMSNSLKRAKADKLYLSDSEESDQDGAMLDDHLQSESDGSFEEELDQQYSDQLLARARQFWDRRVETLAEIAKQGEAMDIDDVSEMLSRKTDNPHELDYIENDYEYNRYISEISAKASEWCVEQMVEDERLFPMEEVRIDGESGVEDDIVASVRQFLQQHQYHLNRSVLVVSGQAWTCYIRCVLHHLGRLQAYNSVVKTIVSCGIDLSSGVVVGSEQEAQVQQIIEKITGTEFHVVAIDVAHGYSAQSDQAHGAAIEIILTGAHFSLLR